MSDEPRRKRGRPVDPFKPKRKMCSFRLLADLYQEALYVTEHLETQLSLTDHVARCVESLVQRARSKYNGGEPIDTKVKPDVYRRRAFAPDQ